MARVRRRTLFGFLAWPGSERKGWLGRQDSNLGMSVPKTDALPLGDAPTVRRCLAAGPGACKGPFGEKSSALRDLPEGLWEGRSPG
jgi:hypothetical protein